MKKPSILLSNEPIELVNWRDLGFSFNLVATTINELQEKLSEFFAELDLAARSDWEIFTGEISFEYDLYDFLIELEKKEKLND